MANFDIEKGYPVALIKDHSSAVERYRVISFGFSDRYFLNNDEVDILLEPVIGCRPFLLVSHAIPSMLDDSVVHRYNILTYVHFGKTPIWIDAQWNAFLQNVQKMNGHAESQLCINGPDDFASYRTHEVLVDKMDAELAEIWMNLPVDVKRVKTKATRKRVKRVIKYKSPCRNDNVNDNK